MNFKNEFIASEVAENSIIRKREAKPFYRSAVESRPLLDDEIEQRNRRLDDRFTSGHYNAHSYSNKHQQLAKIEPLVKSAPIVAKQGNVSHS